MWSLNCLLLKVDIVEEETQTFCMCHIVVRNPYLTTFTINVKTAFGSIHVVVVTYNSRCRRHYSTGYCGLNQDQYRLQNYVTWESYSVALGRFIDARAKIT